MHAHVCYDVPYNSVTEEDNHKDDQQYFTKSLLHMHVWRSVRMKTNNQGQRIAHPLPADGLQLSFPLSFL